jgi:hypothetical protein
MNCRGTATSTIWRVTLSRWLKTLAPILVSFSRAPAIAQMYIDDSDGPLLFGLGIHGLYLFVDAEWQLVVAKVSSQELPLDAARITSTLRAVRRYGAPWRASPCARRSRATAAYLAAIPAGGSNGPPQ